MKCLEQAGGLNGASVDFAAVLTLWVAPELSVAVYDEVAAQVRAQVPVRA